MFCHGNCGGFFLIIVVSFLTFYLSTGCKQTWKKHSMSWVTQCLQVHFCCIQVLYKKGETTHAHIDARTAQTLLHCSHLPLFLRKYVTSQSLLQTVAVIATQQNNVHGVPATPVNSDRGLLWLESLQGSPLTSSRFSPTPQGDVEWRWHEYGRMLEGRGSNLKFIWMSVCLLAQRQLPWDRTQSRYAEEVLPSHNVIETKR